MRSTLRQEIRRQVSLRRYVRPDIRLQHLIAHYTLYHSCEASLPLMTNNEFVIMPDASGCIVYVFNDVIGKCLLWGPTTRARTVNDDRNNYLFIEFLPAGLAALIGIDAGEITDKVYDLALVDRLLFQQITDRITTCNTIDELTAALNRLFLARLSGFNGNINRTQQLINRILTYQGVMKISDLCEEFAISQRQLNRVFQQHVGMSAKSFGQIARINYAIELVRSMQHPLSYIAHELHFYDEAHFIHQFQEITRHTPNYYQQNKADFYNEPYKF